MASLGTAERSQLIARFSGDTFLSGGHVRVTMQPSMGQSRPGTLYHRNKGFAFGRIKLVIKYMGYKKEQIN